MTLTLPPTMLVAGLQAFHASRLDRVAPRSLTGVGAILTFHNVCPARQDGFQPNRNLEITPTFLDELLSAIRAAGHDIVSLDEAHRRLTEGDLDRRFVVLTFDDGCRDVRTFAYPVLKRHGAPFAVFVVSRFADGTGDLWWIALERAIAASDRLDVTIAGTRLAFALTDDRARYDAFTRLSRALAALPEAGEMHAIVRKIADDAGVPVDGICREVCMDWQEIADLAADPLVTIGSHTDTHLVLGNATADEARADIARSMARIEASLGVRPDHLCYPFGGRGAVGPREFRIAEELGFKTGLTTRRGMLFAEHRDHLTALPRITVNGSYQKLGVMQALLSGVPTAIANRLSRIRCRLNSIPWLRGY